MTGLAYEEAKINTLFGAYFCAGKERLKIRSREPKAYVLDRKLLAETCAKAARTAGARIKLGSRMDSKKLLELSKDPANIIIGADGAVSTVARAFGFPAINNYVLTYKAELDVSAPPERDMVALYFSKEFAHGLFGWHVPYSKDIVEVGLGVGHRKGKNSKAAFDAFMKSGMVASEITSGKIISEHASIIPTSSRKITVKNNIALVGDAAGQVKATTGGGIIFGCLSAEVLKNTILSHIEKGKSLELYEQNWRSKYGADLRMHALAHYYYTKSSIKALERTMGICRALGFDKFLAKYGDMDRPTGILKKFILRGIAKQAVAN
jgi:flavin-dependent dehydrogenase